MVATDPVGLEDKVRERPLSFLTSVFTLVDCLPQTAAAAVEAVSTDSRLADLLWMTLEVAPVKRCLSQSRYSIAMFVKVKKNARKMNDSEVFFRAQWLVRGGELAAQLCQL